VRWRGNWRHYWGVGSGMLALGHFLRQATDGPGHAVCSRPRVKVGGGQQRLLLSGHSTDGERQKLGGQQRCCMPSSYVLYKGTYVPYEGTLGTPDQGQTLDV
jgi:hypothetical protein